MSTPARPVPSPDAAHCYHCGDPLPDGAALHARVLGAPRPVCCAGCRAVAEAIVGAGLEDYYRHRTHPATTGQELVPAFLREARVYDDDRVAGAYVREPDEDRREVSLVLEGITCAACLWLNEHRLGALPGVESAQVNYATHRARVVWRPSRTRLSAILEALKAIGYSAHPYEPAREAERAAVERRDQIRRLGLAGLLGMQVMMLAVAMYAGDRYGMADEYRDLFRWVSLVLATPIVGFAARPFFAGAWRDLRNASPGMDVPVALGLTIAYVGSAYATARGTGEVYFDSVAMFVFLLLLARFLERAARQRLVEVAERLAHGAPVMATRLREEAGAEADEVVPVAELRAGDRVLVRPGDQVPADGLVLDGRSSVDEALLTGESRPVAKRIGDALIAGGVNYESPLVMAVERVGDETVVQRILQLVDRAREERPRIARIADRAARWFVAAMLLVAAVTAAWWWQRDPTRWLPTTVAVLVVTCPCALSLATPTALAAGLSALLARGVVVTRSRALETLARVNHFVFDKTGTLTAGRFTLMEVRPLAGDSETGLLAVAAALESRSEHPLAAAVRSAVPPGPAPALTDVRAVPGAGVSARVDGRLYHLGTVEHVRATAAVELPPELTAALDGDPRSIMVLADEDRARAVLFLEDQLRPGARELVASLQARGLAVSLYSGDRPAVTARVAGALGIRDAAGDQGPTDKVARVRALQARGQRVAMTGDGINDAPVLAAADVSIALGHGAHATRASADLVLVTDDLSAIAWGHASARQTRRVIAQNLTWALAYNILAVPAAATGRLEPWMAAVGMSLSSLLVVANSLRAGRRRGAMAAGG